MADGWLLCPSASSARDILPAVVCSVIVTPALAAPDLPGMTAVTATWMVHGARPTLPREGSATKLPPGHPVRGVTLTGIPARFIRSPSVALVALLKQQQSYVTIAAILCKP